VGLECLGQRDGQGANRGELTGLSPTDRAKRGGKRHLLTDGRGAPLSAILSAANTHDKWLLAPTLDAVVLRAGPYPRRPRHCCLDKGYAFRDCEAALAARHIVAHIRQKGEPPLVGRVPGRPRRWVVERTNSWHNRYRALLIRWERKAQNYVPLHHGPAAPGAADAVHEGAHLVCATHEVAGDGVGVGRPRPELLLEERIVLQPERGPAVRDRRGWDRSSGAR
jgi:putative transposase